MPKNFYAYSCLLALGVIMVLWWHTIEHLWLVPKVSKITREGLAILAKLRIKNLTDETLCVKNGDLLFFRGLSWSEKTIQTYTLCRYNHVAMVVIDQGSRYLWEADVGEAYRQGPRLVPLETKLAKWGGTKEVAIRRIDKEVDKRQILDFARGRLDTAFDRSMLRWLFAWWPRKEECYFCSELIAETLITLGILDPRRRASSYSPRDLAYGPIRGYLDLQILA